MSCKIVYYGPGFSGKTTNIQKIHEQMPGDRKGELTSIKTEGDRTLFFDFMALDLGKVAGMDIRFQIYTVPGQVYYGATRKLVLQGADGIVFVADSSPDRMQANMDSWQDLEHNLAERNLSIRELPVVVQWNKRDLPGALATEEMNRRINLCGAPSFEAIACRGEGVLSTLKCICTLVCRSVSATQLRGRTSSEAELRAAEVRAAAQACPLAAHEMRFVARRANADSVPAAGVPSEPVVLATAVVEREEAPKAPGVVEKRPAAQWCKEQAPAPPKAKRPMGPAAVGSRRKPSRSDRVSVIAVAMLLAAAAGVAVALYLLKVW